MSLSQGRSLALCVGVLVALTVLRLLALRFSAVDLYFDEAQYWAWSRDLAFGYFSKPPLIAWIIRLFDDLCGSGEACVRAAAPLIHLGTALVVYAIARDLYGARTALWTALTFALGTGVAFSARIISTDVPLLFFWALALFAYLRFLRAPSLGWAVLLGAALGFGMLAKYAMAYFLAGIVLAQLIDAEARAALRRREFWLALAIAALMLVPNIHWNIANGLVTLRHTGENIQGGGLRFDPLKALEFLAAQFAVLGPVVFGGLLVLLLRLRRMPLEQADRLMLAFALPPLAIVTAVALVRGAAANWAAPAAVGATLLVVALLVRYAAWGWIKAGLGLGIAVQLVLFVADAFAYRVSVPGLGVNGDVYRRTLGWRALGERTGELARRAGAPTVAAESRYAVASLTYYLRDSGRAVRAWPAAGPPNDHFQLAQPLAASSPGPVLFVSQCPGEARLAAHYAKVEPLGGISTPTGPHTSQSYFAFRLSEPRGPLGPLGPCG